MFSDSRQGWISKTLMIILMTVIAFVFIFPIYFMVVTSFKPNNLAVRDMGSIMAFVPRTSSAEVPLPEDWTTFENYKQLFRRLDVGRMIFNSILITFAVIIARMFVDSMFAFSLARLKWRGQRVILFVIIALIIIPFEAIAVPLLLMVNSFGWINSYHVQIIPFVSSPLAIFLFYQFFLGFPRELEEAARIDGASVFRIYANIVVPMSTPVFSTVAILGFLEIWGSFLWPLMVTRDVTYRPVIVGLFYFFDQRPVWGEIMAYASLITIPILIIFLLLQRWFIESVASSGVKG
jgi:multiple sugar transport system permease protein